MLTQIVHACIVTDAREPVILFSESQREVAAVAWRPNAGMMLSVACRCVSPRTLFM